MKKYIYMMLTVAIASLFGSCSKDDPFGYGMTSATGQFRTSSLDVSMVNSEGPRDIRNRKVRMAAPSTNDFTVAFYREGMTTPDTTFLYGSMPEVVTLKVGTYTAVASYGTNPVADWDTPYYEGRSQSFTITADEITEVKEPIICKISNVRVSVSFTDELKAALSGDWVVKVKVGREGELDFTSATADKYGYFRYDEGSNTLAAEFSGMVDGVMSKAVLTEINVEAGKHYDIRFKMYDAGEEDPGYVIPNPSHGGGLVGVDASVSEQDMNVDIDSDIPTIDEGTGRPQEGEEPKEDPTPSQPEDPSKPLPTIVAQSPYDIDRDNELLDGQAVVLDIKSLAANGITGFTVRIDSDTLDPFTLEDVGLTDTLDIVNPGAFEDKLKELGFPVNVGGQKEVQFVITDEFITLIKLLGEGHHKFILTVTDANGTATKTLRLHNN